MSGVDTREAVRDLRTPLSRARGIGSGKSGTEHFWRQRGTAIALALLVPWLVGLLVSMVGTDLAAVRETLARPWNAVLLAAFVIASFWHAKLGIQVIIEDYVLVRWAEITLLLFNLLACAFGALASLYAIGRIAMLG